MFLNTPIDFKEKAYMQLKYFPFTYIWIFRRAMGKDIETVLDLGCGDGEFMKKVKSNEEWMVTGLDLYSESLDSAKRKGIYQKLVKGDVENIPPKVRKNEYDVVTSSQVLEHLEKNDGKVVLPGWEKLAKRRLVVSTPVGYIKYSPIERQDIKNPLLKHLSGWDPGELKKRGFSVRGQGARIIYGEKGIARKFPNVLFLMSLVGLLLAPIVYFLPNYATYMVAWKRFGDD